VGRIAEAEASAGDGAQPGLVRGLVETGNAVDAVAIAERQGGVAELGGSFHQVFGVGGALQEGEGAPGSQLDVIPARALVTGPAHPGSFRFLFACRQGLRRFSASPISQIRLQSAAIRTIIPT
jgi:hypothetical protein